MKTKLVIFGITGDLSTRKLLPALEHIIATHSSELSIIGVSRRQVDVAELLQSAVGSTELAPLTSVYSMDLATASDYHGLREYIALQDDEQLLVYLSVPPSAAADIADFLGAAGLNTPNVKLLFEKPFGFDLASAHEVIERTTRYYDESHIYRIDHYLAKDVAQEIIALRSDADNHHHHWNHESIRSIDIIASESIGVEGRATFYEETGALRDIVQGHLMQLLSLVLMDIPADITFDDLPAYRQAALQALQPADPLHTKRGQYDTYSAEVGNPGSLTETFVNMPLVSTDPRWSGVAIRLMTGKAMAEKKTHIQVTYTDGTTDAFTEGHPRSDGSPLVDAYERVLIEAINSRKSLFAGSGEVIRAWQIVQPLLNTWEMDSQPIALYPTGSIIESL